MAIIDDSGDALCSYPNHHLIGRASDGKLWVLYPTGIGTTYQISSAVSLDDGVTWVGHEIVFTSAWTSGPIGPLGLVVDSSGIPHMVFLDLSGSITYRLKYTYRDPVTGWAAPYQILSSGTHMRVIGLAIDSADDLHLLYGIYSATGHIYYRKRTAGVWGAAEIVGDTSLTVAVHGAIAVDSIGVIHASWWEIGIAGAQNASVKNIVYRQKTGGGWQAVELVTDMAGATEHQGYPHLVLDSADDVYLSWTGLGWSANPTYQNIQFRKRASGVWQTQEALTDVAFGEQWNPCLAMDRGGDIHCAWDGRGWGSNPGYHSVQYREKTGGSWQPQVDLVNRAISLKCFDLLWGSHPGESNIVVDGFNLVFGEGYPLRRLEFYLAPTVTTDPATGLGQPVVATLNGTLDDDGGMACDCGFEYGETEAYGTTTPTESKETGETFSQAITGLSHGTIYHFRAIATNSGTSYGSDRIFRTRSKCLGNPNIDQLIYQHVERMGR